jgi:hypothetical protein
MRCHELCRRGGDLRTATGRTAPRVRRASRLPHVAPGLIAVSLAAAACGGPAGHSLAELSSSTTTRPPASTAAVSPRQDVPAQPSEVQRELLEFAQCTRSHGVANFPGPGSKRRPKAGSLDPYGPQFQRVARDCKSFLAPVTGTGNG